jgi:hypothetical protein
MEDDVFESLARRQKKFIRTAKQAYLRSFRSSTKYKYRHEIPRDYHDAMRLLIYYESQNERHEYVHKNSNDYDTKSPGKAA